MMTYSCRPSSSAPRASRDMGRMGFFEAELWGLKSRIFMGNSVGGEQGSDALFALGD